jgi:hypothetical protein
MKAETEAVHPHLISSVGEQILGPRCRDLPKAIYVRRYKSSDIAEQSEIARVIPGADALESRAKIR